MSNGVGRVLYQMTPIWWKDDPTPNSKNTSQNFLREKNLKCEK